MQALNRANEIRLARAELKRKLKADETTVSEVLEEMPDCIHSMLVIELLGAQRQWSKNRSRKLLHELAEHGVAHISEWRKCGALTDRERRIIAEWTDRKKGAK